MIRTALRYAISSILATLSALVAFVLVRLLHTPEPAPEPLSTKPRNDVPAGIVLKERGVPAEEFNRLTFGLPGPRPAAQAVSTGSQNKAHPDGQAVNAS